MLKDIFEKQELLFKKIFGKLPTASGYEEKRDSMIDCVLSSYEELGELRDEIESCDLLDEKTEKSFAKAFNNIRKLRNQLNLTKFKLKTPNVNAAKEELIDLMHMVVQMALLLDMKADEFHDVFVRKHRYNLTRVDHKSANDRTDI